MTINSSNIDTVHSGINFTVRHRPGPARSVVKASIYASGIDTGTAQRDDHPLDRKDFGLRWNEARETGGVLVRDHLEPQLELQGVRTAAAAA